MNDPVRFGQFDSERIADENQQCRQIAAEISNFGVSERQRLLVIYLLALELENVEHMRSVTNLVKELSTNLFIATQDVEDTNG